MFLNGELAPSSNPFPSYIEDPRFRYSPSPCTPCNRAYGVRYNPLPLTGSISYEQFMELSKKHIHVLYPVTQVAHKVPMQNT